MADNAPLTVTTNLIEPTLYINEHWLNGEFITQVSDTDSCESLILLVAIWTISLYLFHRCQLYGNTLKMRFLNQVYIFTADPQAIRVNTFVNTEIKR